MNKTEMAEWLAQNVLGLEEQIDPGWGGGGNTAKNVCFVRPIF